MEPNIEKHGVKYVTSSRIELWDEYLDACVFAYNTSHQELSLHAPFEIMFGRKAVIPIELTYLDPGSRLLINDMKSSESVVPVSQHSLSSRYIIRIDNL